MTDTDDDRLLRALEAVKAGARHSPAYLWMRRHYDALSKQFETHHPSWVALADFLRQEGIYDRTGNPPRPRIVAQTWRRLSEDMKRLKPPRQPKPPKTVWPKEPGEIAPGVRPASVEAPAESVPVQPEPAGMPDYLTEQLSVGQRHLTKRGV